MEGEMNHVELNMRLLKGAIQMREDERRCHEAFWRNDCEFPRHKWEGIENVVRYWVRHDLLPDRDEMVDLTEPALRVPERKKKTIKRR